MDTLLNFQPFVFSSASAPGSYVEGLPLTSPVGSVLASHGRIFGLFCITYPEVFPIDQMGREVFPFFEGLYYQGECVSVHGHLLDCVRQTQAFIEKKILEYGNVENIDFSLCIGVVWGSVLYTVRCGGMTGMRLYREATFGNLFETDDSSGSSLAVSLSGYIQPNDTLCLFNRSVDTSHFPLTLGSLKELDSALAYSKLAQYFNEPIQTHPSCCIVGCYVGSDAVPSIEEESIVFAESREEDVTSPLPLTEDPEFVEKELAVDAALSSPVPERERLFSSEASIRGFSAKIIPSAARGKIAAAGKKITSFFTRRRVFILGCMILLLFAGFIFIGHDYENRFKNQKQTAVLKSEILPQAEEAYKQGLYYAELNPERAKNYLQEARRVISQFDEATLKDPEVQKLSRDIESAYGVVTKTYALTDLSPYFDLSTVNAQAVGERFALTGTALLVADVAHNSVYQVGTETRSASAVIGPNDLDGLIGAEGDKTVTYGVSARKGIVRTQEQSSEVVRLLEPADVWGTLTDVQLFGGNLYLLDQGKAQIWKYIPEGNGFGPVRNYISSDVTVDLSDAVSFAIDGNVWIGKKSGDIIKLFSGKEDTFSVSGVEGDLTNVRAVATDAEIDFLYILDEMNARVVVVSKKDGSYVSTYTSPEFKDASDILIDVAQKQLYVLTKQKIFKVELKENVTKKE